MRNDVWQRRSEIPCMADGVHQPFYTQSPRFTTVMSDSTAATSRLTLNLPTINLTNDMQQVRDFQENYVNFMEWSNTGEDMVTGNAIARNVVLQNGLSNKLKKKEVCFSFQICSSNFFCSHPTHFLHNMFSSITIFLLKKKGGIQTKGD